jgi:hypothetical protein
MLSSLAHAGWDRDEVIRVGSLEIRPRQGLALAGGSALTLSVREFGLLVALARRDGDARDGAPKLALHPHARRVRLPLRARACTSR